MRHVIVRTGSLIGAAGATLLLAGGALAATSTSASSSVTGPEVVSGQVHGKAALANVTHIPLTLTGIVATTDRGFVLGNGGGNTHTLTTPAGKLTVRGSGKPIQKQTMNAKTCRFTFTERQQGQVHRRVRAGRVPDHVQCRRPAVHLGQAQGPVQPRQQRPAPGEGSGCDVPCGGCPHRQVGERSAAGPAWFTQNRAGPVACGTGWTAAGPRRATAPASAVAGAAPLSGQLFVRG
jgi:hypothetical protein